MKSSIWAVLLLGGAQAGCSADGATSASAESESLVEGAASVATARSELTAIGQDCSAFNGYTAALATATVDCLGTIRPDSFRVDERGFLQRSFNACSVDAAMLYLSDHGESLGETGLYLHGLPYAIAPETQKKVPMIAWLSPQFANANGVDRACLLGKADEPLSHDNLFHSVIGVLDVRTRVYRPERDVFEGCRVPPGSAYARSAAR